MLVVVFAPAPLANSEWSAAVQQKSRSRSDKRVKCGPYIGKYCDVIGVQIAVSDTETEGGLERVDRRDPDILSLESQSEGLRHAICFQGSR